MFLSRCSLLASAFILLLAGLFTLHITHHITQSLNHTPPVTSTSTTSPSSNPPLAGPSTHFTIVTPLHYLHNLFMEKIAAWRPAPTPISLPWPVFTVGIRIVDYLHSLVLLMAPTQIVLLWHASGFVKTGALHAAAQLGIADALAMGPLTIEQLANITDSHGPALLRLLRALETLSTFSELPDGRWCNSILSEYMRHDHPASMRSAVMMFGQEQFVAFSKLDHTIQTGEPAFQHVYGQDFWAYHRQNKVAAAIFDGSMTSLSVMVDLCIAEDIDFSPYAHLADVGGGHGSLLQHIMIRYPHLHGILFDQPTVIASVEKEWQHTEFVNRSTLVSGDLFQHRDYPKAEAYIIKQTLHDFSDADCIQILSNIHSAYTRSDGKLLIVERMMRKGASFIQSQGTAFADLLMMSNFGRGRERYHEDFVHLLESSGFQLVQVHPTRTVYFVIEAIRVPNVQHTTHGGHEKKHMNGPDFATSEVIPLQQDSPILSDTVPATPSAVDTSMLPPFLISSEPSPSSSSGVPAVRYPSHVRHHEQDGEFTPEENTK